VEPRDIADQAIEMRGEKVSRILKDLQNTFRPQIDERTVQMFTQCLGIFENRFQNRDFERIAKVAFTFALIKLLLYWASTPEEVLPCAFQLPDEFGTEVRCAEVGFQDNSRAESRACYRIGQF
jgi:hypothetical protein